jgi:hypothetical protein
VGAIRLRRVNSQYDLMGALHCDYHDNVNKKVPDEHPQSIIMALDLFKLLYESNMGTGGLLDRQVKELFVNCGQAVVFSSSFCPAGGSNHTIDQTGYLLSICVYCFGGIRLSLQSRNKGQTLKCNMFDLSK